jgi:hypothetical protein
MSRQVINNFLPREEFLAIKTAILSDNFPWTLHEKSYPGETGCEDRFNCQFVHVFYQSPTMTSQHINVINPLIKRLQHNLFIRAKANITTAAENIQVYGYHTDIPEELAKMSKTAIFYLNTNDGYTIFEKDGEKIDSLENRMLIFDSAERHSGTNCTNQKYRAVINFNFI